MTDTPEKTIYVVTTRPTRKGAELLPDGERLLEKLRPWMVDGAAHEILRARAALALPGLSDDEGRAVSAWTALTGLVAAFAAGHPPDEVQRLGMLDLQEFIDALRAGSDHPLLARWQALRKVNASNPVQTPREKSVRAVAGECSLSLQAARERPNRARTLTAAMLNKARIVPGCKTSAVRYWEGSVSEARRIVAAEMAQEFTVEQILAQYENSLTTLGRPATHVSMRVAKKRGK